MAREIINAAPPSMVVIKLDSSNRSNAITQPNSLQPQAGMTAVTWAMFGPTVFIPNLMGLFFSMDSMIGKSFESGLANVKADAEN